MKTNLITNKYFSPLTTTTAATTITQEKTPKENNSKKILLSLAGLAALGTASYLIFRSKAPKKINTKLESSLEKVQTELKENLEPKVERLQTEVKSALATTTKTVKSLLKDGRSKVEISSVDDVGKHLRDIRVYNKDNSITRVIQTKNPKTGEMFSMTYKGDKTILNNPETFEGGQFNPEYFVKQIIKTPKTAKKGCFEHKLTTITKNKQVHRGITTLNDKPTHIFEHISDAKIDKTDNTYFSKEGKISRSREHAFANENGKITGARITTRHPKNQPEKFIYKGKEQTKIPSLLDPRFANYFIGISS